MEFARTTKGRMNDYVTPTLFSVPENNNQGLGSTSQPSEIKVIIGNLQQLN